MSTISSQRFADTVLSDLVGNVQSFGDTVRTFLQRTGDTEILVPDMKLDFMSIDEPVPMEFFDKLGIRRLILNAFPGRRESPIISYLSTIKQEPVHHTGMI